MKKVVDRLIICTLLVSFVAFLAGVVLLFLPVGWLQGSADFSSALTTSLALIVATLGLVAAVYMQSAEYRRETEIVDGLQEIRILLEVIISKSVMASMSQVHGTPYVFDIDLEKEKLLESMLSNGGRFLRYIASVRDSETPVGESEEFRGLYLHVAQLSIANDFNGARSAALDLLGLVTSVTGLDIKKYAGKVISHNAPDEMSKWSDIIVKAEQNRRAEAEEAKLKAADVSDAELEEIIQFLYSNLPNDAIKSLESSIKSARSGDRQNKAELKAYYDYFFQNRSKSGDQEQPE